MPTHPAPPPITTPSGLHTSFTTFLTTALHLILAERRVYPSSSFVPARAYSYPVHQNRHPRVRAWIADAVRAVDARLRAGDVARVAVVLFEPPGAGRRTRALERFVFDVSRLPGVPEGLGDAVMVREGEGTDEADAEGVGAGEREARLRADMEEEFRAVMAGLVGCGERLAPVPEGCTFTVAMELKEGGRAPIGHPQAWVPVEAPLQARKGDGKGEVVRGEGLGGEKVTAVRAVEVGEMSFEVWIEEGKAKWEERD